MWLYSHDNTQIELYQVLWHNQLPVKMVQKQLPEVVRAHVGSAEGLVKEIAHEAAAQIVRDVAGEQVGQLVATAVPDIAEAEIKKEIQRLTGSA